MLHYMAFIQLVCSLSSDQQMAQDPSIGSTQSVSIIHFELLQTKMVFSHLLHVLTDEYTIKPSPFLKTSHQVTDLKIVY